MTKPNTTQRGSATMIITVGVIVVVAITVAAGAFFMLNKGKPTAVSSDITAPMSPYDNLSETDSNNDLKRDVLNLNSGMAQEDEHLKGTASAINDTPNLIADN